MALGNLPLQPVCLCVCIHMLIIGLWGVSVTMVYGVPTVKRARESYLIRTLEHLVNGLDDQEKEDSLIVIFVGEVSTKRPFPSDLIFFCFFLPTRICVSILTHC